MVICGGLLEVGVTIDFTAIVLKQMLFLLKRFIQEFITRPFIYIVAYDCVLSVLKLCLFIKSGLLKYLVLRIGGNI